MKVELKKITIRELVAGYEDAGDEGVSSINGTLDIRPPYQRNFVYDDEQRKSVIETVMKGFPLNIMYWAVRDDGTFEVIDGQQRTISICQYFKSNFSIPDSDENPVYFHSMLEEQKEKFLDYELTVYRCTGSEKEKLDWFEIVNIAGEELTKQELRNAVYCGAWVTAAKIYFSKRNCAAEGIGKNYLSGSANRQEYLETAIKWISDGEIGKYMSQNRNKDSAKPLWDYFVSVIEWVEEVFPIQRKKIMKGVDWGGLHRQFKDEKLNAEALEEEISKLLQDEDVTNHKGVYPYVLTRDEKHLNIRAFSDIQKRRKYEEQEGKCPDCGEKFVLEAMEGDHITPWSQGGKTEPDNLQMLCKECNRAKGAS